MKKYNYITFPPSMKLFPFKFLSCLNQSPIQLNKNTLNTQIGVSVILWVNIYRNIHFLLQYVSTEKHLQPSKQED